MGARCLGTMSPYCENDSQVVFGTRFMLKAKGDCVNRNLICQLCQLPLMPGDGTHETTPS